MRVTLFAKSTTSGSTARYKAMQQTEAESVAAVAALGTPPGNGASSRLPFAASPAISSGARAPACPPGPSARATSPLELRSGT
jgi:hypothetical protein